MKVPWGPKALEYFPVGKSFWFCLFVCLCNIFISSLLHVGVSSVIQEEKIIVAGEIMLGCILTINVNYEGKHLRTTVAFWNKLVLQSDAAQLQAIPAASVAWVKMQTQAVTVFSGCRPWLCCLWDHYLLPSSSFSKTQSYSLDTNF